MNPITHQRQHDIVEPYIPYVMARRFGDLINKTPINVRFQDYTTIHKRVYVLYTCENGEDFASSLSN